MINRPVMTAFAIACCLVAADAKASGWGLNLEGGATYAGWFTSDDDDNEEGVGHAIDYEAGGAQSWSVGASIRYGDLDVFGLDVTRPFGETPEQQEIIEKTTSATTAAQDYIAFLQMAGILSPESSGFTRFLSGLRLDYRRFYFHGKAAAVERAVFASRESGEILLEVGDEFQYEANFEDWYFTLVRLATSDGRVIRLGAYHSVLEKPHETMEWAHDSGGADLVVETRLTGRGIFMQGGKTSWDFLLRLGTVDFEAMGDLDQRVYRGEGSFAMAMEFGWHPRIVLAGAPASGRFSEPRVALEPAAGFLFRADYLNPEFGEAGSADGELSMDILVEAGVRLVWRF